MSKNNSFIFRFIAVIFVLQCLQSTISDAQHHGTIGSTNFQAAVKNQKLFVDKTLFIEAVLNSGYENLLITVARRFGKSSNLKMLECFFEVEVDKNGLPLTKIDLQNETSTVNDTPNYAIFTKYNLKITKYTRTMSSYFGKFPVVLLDLHCSLLYSYTCVLFIAKQALQSAYSHHIYLLESSILSLEDKKYIANWALPKVFEYNQTDSEIEDLVKQGLIRLMYLLQKHFKREVVLLIDEYDSAITRALQEPSLDNNTINKIINFYVALLADICKNNRLYSIKRIIITGLTCITDVYTSALNNIGTFKFLRNDQFVDFFGFFLAEFEMLMDKNDVNAELKEQAISYYDGYRYKGKRIFTPWSLVRFVNSKKIESYWTGTKLIFTFRDIFAENQHLFSLMETLVNNHSIKFKYLNKFTTTDLTELHNFLNNLPVPITKQAHMDNIILTIFYNNGYISPTSQITTDTKLDDTIEGKIPNQEISSFISEVFLNCLRIKEPPFDYNRMESCGKLFKQVSFTNFDDLYRTLSGICNHIKIIIEKFFNKRDPGGISEFDLHATMNIILQYAYQEYQITSISDSDVLYSAGREQKVEPDITMLSKTKPIAIVMELRFMEKTKVALQAAIKKSHTEPFRGKARDFVLMGICVDVKLNVYISLIINDTNIDNSFSLDPKSLKLEPNTENTLMRFRTPKDQIDTNPPKSNKPRSN